MSSDLWRYLGEFLFWAQLVPEGQQLLIRLLFDFSLQYACYQEIKPHLPLADFDGACRRAGVLALALWVGTRSGLYRSSHSFYPFTESLHHLA